MEHREEFGSTSGRPGATQSIGRLGECFGTNLYRPTYRPVQKSLGCYQADGGAQNRAARETVRAATEAVWDGIRSLEASNCRRGEAHSAARVTSSSTERIGVPPPCGRGTGPVSSPGGTSEVPISFVLCVRATGAAARHPPSCSDTPRAPIARTRAGYRDLVGERAIGAGFRGFR